MVAVSAKPPVETGGLKLPVVLRSRTFSNDVAPRLLVRAGQSLAIGRDVITATNFMMSESGVIKPRSRLVLDWKVSSPSQGQAPYPKTQGPYRVIIFHPT